MEKVLNKTKLERQKSLMENQAKDEFIEAIINYNWCEVCYQDKIGEEKKEA